MTVKKKKENYTLKFLKKIIYINLILGLATSASFAFTGKNKHKNDKKVNYERNISNPFETLRAKAYSHLLARSIHMFAYFKIADYVNGVVTDKQIADIVSLDSSALTRVGNVLINHGIFTRNKSGALVHNNLSEPLKSNVSNSLQKALAKEFDHKRWNAIGNIDIAMQGNKVPFDSLYAQSFYDYLESDKEAAKLFNQGMGTFSEIEDKDIAEIYDFTPYGRICDLGGGKGGLLENILNTYPNLEGALFELEGALNEATIFKNNKYNNRVKGIKGSFFDSTPSGYDLYILKRVVHNWSDEKSIQIIRNCRKTMKPGAKLLIIEKIMPTDPDGSFLVDSDIIALGLSSGRERTLSEFQKLGSEAGLQYNKITNSKTGISIIEFERR
jgi:hypothetical protein